MSHIRRTIYETISGDEDASVASKAYNLAMIAFIVASLIPLMFKDEVPLFTAVDMVCTSIFIADYLMRWITADMRFGSKSPMSFVKYPFTPMAIIDLLSILPSFLVVNEGLRALRIVRLVRAMRVLRVFRMVRYSKNLMILGKVARQSSRPLAIVGALALGYIYVSALIIFNIEPDSFGTFFDALYWATVSLTTVGYGDLYPVTDIGRMVAMVSSIFGIAIVALPAGIITAGYMEAIESEKEE